MEHRRACALGMDDGRMEDVLAGETFGASLRLVDGETTRFADLIAPSLEELLEAARTLAAPGRREPAPVPPLVAQLLAKPSPIDREPGVVPLTEKVDLVRRADHLARHRAETLKPGALRQVALGYGDSTQNVWIAAAEKGEDGLDRHPHRGPADPEHPAAERDRGGGRQPADRLPVPGRDPGLRAVHLRGGGTHRAGGGAPGPPGPHRTPRPGRHVPGDPQQQRRRHHDPRGLRPRPGGRPGPGRGERLRRQAGPEGGGRRGHHHRRRHPAAQARLQPPATTRARPAQRVVLIEHGILKAYLQSRKTARKMGAEPTGNGRRESYRHMPIPRMRNTFLAPGQEAPEAILKDLDRGLLVKHMGGGQVDTVTGNFVFQVTEGYWVEKGVGPYPVKNATLTGCGPEVLMGLTRIGSDLHHFDIGTCGKDGQGVPVSDALPTILCPALIVGGTAEILPGIL